MMGEEANGICDGIRQIAYDLHVYLGIGYLEKFYGRSDRGAAYAKEIRKLWL